MTITFENDNDAIIHALDKIISFARSHQYIFLAQCIWWIASIIGLQQGLATHIHNLRKSVAITDRTISEERLTHIAIDNSMVRNVVIVQEQSASRRDIQEDSRFNPAFDQVHPDRRIQVNQEADDYELDQHFDKVIDKAECFLERSEERRKKVDPFCRTCQGKLIHQKLTQKERNRLNQVSPDQIRDMLWNRI